MTSDRFLGFDLGAETIKIVELVRATNGAGPMLHVGRRLLVEHRKSPAVALRQVLQGLDWPGVRSAAATGRVSRLLRVHRMPVKAALARGVAHALPDFAPGTVVSIGSHGFSVLELRPGGHQVHRENSRCSQGTGNFLRQLVERFDLSPEEASRLCADVAEPAALSGRCPVILKTDMTHLANKGAPRPAILAGLYDAVCENVQVLLKPGVAPPDVLLVGGVARAPRVRANFRAWLASRGMRLVDCGPEEHLYLEALGAALVASERPAEALPSLDDVVKDDSDGSFDRVPALRDSLDRVHRMAAVPMVDDDRSHRVVLGFDIGSTGSKALAVDVGDRALVWEGYRRTLGNPVEAARRLAADFLEQTGGRHEIAALGATGSGREITGSLMASALGAERVFVLNEIAAHAAGALHFDDTVDTIFEIGGQDAKYIRLDAGRICDAAMNEACSAGTGSFIEEQGSKFDGVDDVVQMGRLAVAADHGISLGQHCSVFMAEIIDEAVCAGVEQGPILAGLYDSIVQNYLNRVKGNRSVGQRIFCQGMPFAADALAAAVARQTGQQVVIPPNPGTIGALGIALLTLDELALDGAPLELEAFLGAELLGKDTFACTSRVGCGGGGNHCRIERLTTRVGERKQRFLWGGHCSLYDRGTTKRRLPDRSPDPFRERRELVEALIATFGEPTGERPVVAIAEEFVLKGLLPFFATYVRGLGFDVRIHAHAGHEALKRGVETANVPFCAPMNLYHGLVAEMLDAEPDILFAPRLRELPRQGDEPHATTCPIVQGSPDVVSRLARPGHPTRFVTGRVDMGHGDFRSDVFRLTVAALAREMGVEQDQTAFDEALAAQERFDGELAAIGRRAMAFAHQSDVVPVVVLGRTYTLYNDVLNSNVPNLLREQGALAIPVECYPVGSDVPIFHDLYWGYSQVNLRAAHQIRRDDGVYAVFCSNYSCGPDSFNLHFFSYVMENKPFAIIETDGHAGDAGTKTRIEAFLYCVEGDLKLGREQRDALARTRFKEIEQDKSSVLDARRRGELMLLPRLGASAECLSALFRSEGMRAETLPMPERSTLRRGRQHTSGKECVPMTITLGSVLEVLDRQGVEPDRLAFFMPDACGPCRFGVYNLMHKIALERTGWKERIRVVTPSTDNYFDGLSSGFQPRLIVGVVAADLLMRARRDVAPVERTAGAAQAIYDRHYRSLVQLMESSRPCNLVQALAEVPSRMFGVRELVEQAAAEFEAARDFTRDVPTIAVVGEIFARLDPFTNDFVCDRLEQRGVRALLAPIHEWFEYTTWVRRVRIQEGRPARGDKMVPAQISYGLELLITNDLWDIFARRLRWGPRVGVDDAVRAAAPWMSHELRGEAVLTLGTPIAEAQHGAIDGVVSVGPHECMPNKLAEAQFVHVGEELGLKSLTLPLNGDPVDPEVLDRFVYEVREAWDRRTDGGSHVGRSLGDRARRLKRKALMNTLKVLTPFARG
jgi:predicted CoA-substrate-specific enzyme activase